MRTGAGAGRKAIPSLLPWGVLSLTLAMAVAGSALRFASNTRPIPDQLRYEGIDLLYPFALLPFAALGALLSFRHPSNPIGWIFVVAGLGGAASNLADGYTVYGVFAHPDALPAPQVMAWVGRWAWIPSGPGFVFLFLLFPNGRLPSRRWRPALWFAAISTLVLVLGQMFAPGRLEEATIPIDNPFGVPGALGRLMFLMQDLGNVATLPAFLAAAASMVFRFRRGRGDERQQLKLLGYSAALVALGAVWIPFGLELFPGTGLHLVPFFLGVMTVPLATAVGIFKYRLYDIDLVINKTLVYGALTVALGLAYFAGVVVLQRLLSPLAGGSDLAVVASTLAVAALFRPARRRIQGFIDRRFYRRKYDAAKTVEAFSTRLRDEIDLDTLRHELTEVVRETVQPEHVALWLRGQER